MEEVEKYADLLSVLETGIAAGASGLAPRPSSLGDDDVEILEWVSLLSKANADVMQKARLRICSSGLLAVHRHITSHPDLTR